MRIAKRIISLIMACVLFVSSADIGVYATELNETDAIVEESEYTSETVQEDAEYGDVSENVQESIERESERTEALESTEYECTELQENTEKREIIEVDSTECQENTESAEVIERVDETEVAENVQAAEETELAEETEVAEVTEITETSEEPRRIPEYADVIKTEVQVISADEIEGKVYAAEELLAVKAELPSYLSQSYGYAWDNYTSYYIYNHLSEDEKKLWDAMEVLYSSYLENETNLRHITEPVRVDTTEISLEELKEFGDLFRYTHPQYYYLMTDICCQMESSYVSVAFFVYKDFQDGIDRKKATEAMQLQLELWCQEISRYDTEEEKVKAIHDIICNAVDYNWEAWNAGLSNTIEEREYTQSAYSVFCTDLTVCAGYTQAFTLLCNAFDIECFGVTNSDHAWNKVKVNDNWYNVDCTWDDGDGLGNIYYDYYLKNDSYIDKTGSHSEGAKWLSYLPGCTLDSGSTFDKGGKVPTVTAQAAAPVITVTKQEKGYTIEMTSATEGADIIYTLDGNMPSESNTKGYVYDGVFELNQDAVLKAIAVCDKYLDSEVTVGEEIKEIVYTVATGMAGENIAWELKSNGQMILTGSGAMTSFTSVDKLPWAAYLKEIEELEIENGITSIANFAFANSNLREVELPDSIRSLGYDAFADCPQLTRVKICGALNHIGDAAFADCDSLVMVELPDTLTKIGKKMFYSCGSLTDIALPDSLKSIGMQAFRYCESLKEVTIPGNAEMEVEVFAYCEGLEKVTIEDGVTALPWYAFYECSTLKEVILPESLQTIGGYVFAKCTALTEITIPSKVAVIEMCALDTSVVIYGYAETEAQNYAIENGNVFIDLFDQGIKVSFVTGTEDAVAMQYYEEESLVTEPTGLVRKGYILEGWYTSQEVQDDTTRWDFEKDTAKQSFTLYAKWIPKVESLVSDIPSGSEVEVGTKITLTTPTDGAKIYYTTESEADLRLWEADGTLDTYAILYEDGIEITKSVMFYVIAVKEGYVCSDILTVSYFVERAEQETPVLTLGTEKIVSLPEWDITNPSVKCEFTVPEDGYYDFGSIVTEGDSTVSLRLLDGETMLEIDTVGASDATTDRKTHMLTSFLEKGTVLYAEYSVWMDPAAQVAVTIQKVPDYKMTSQQDGSYSGGTEELVLKTDIEAGCKTIRIGIDLYVKEGVTGEESYYLKTYYAKKNERLEYSSTGLSRDYFDYSGTDVIEAEERTAYEMFYVLERLAENYELIPIALFEGDISVTTKESEKPYVIHKTEILEDAITLDIESFVSGYIYYAPTDHSELEQKVGLRNTWDSVVLENLKPGTEYYLDFVSHQSVLYGTETISTAVSDKVVTYDASCIWDESSESIRVQAEVTGYKGSAYYANLHASYTDALGIKKQIIGSYYLGKIEDDGENGKDFVVWTEQSATLEAGATYEIECWLEFRAAGSAETVVQEKQVLQVTTPESTIQKEDIVFSLSEGDTGDTVCYTISAGVEENETLYGTLYYKPYGAPASEYEHYYHREWIPIRAGENTGTIANMLTGVKYDMILLIEGVKKEFTDTIGTAKFELALGEADVNICGFSHSMEVKAKQGHTGSYELKGYYRDGKESTGYWREFGSPITLNEENAYKTEFKSASYTKLDPVSTYEIKWEVTASDGSVYTAYETIQTEQPVISFEKGIGYIDSQEYTFYLDEENVPEIENFSDDMYLFIRKAGTERFREVGLIGLNNWSGTGNTPYTCRMRIQGLDAETTYEISVRSANRLEYTEYLTTSFTTAADTRTVTVGEIEVTTKSAVIPYELSGLDGIQMTYVYLYLREKDAQTEWKQYDDTYYFYEWQNTSGEFTIGIYYGENYLTPDTTYEYLIGFGGENEKADTLRRTLEGEFTTQEDLREITVNEVTPYKSSADISYSLSNVGTEVVAVVTYIREKGTENPWIMGGYNTYLGDGKTDAQINMRYYGRVGVEQLLKEETTYQYCIGFQNDIDEGKEALEKPFCGEFTTVKDTRKVEVTSERSFFNAAKIEYQISGLECIDDTMFCLYLRKKDSGDEWEESDYTYLDALDEPSSEYVFETYKGEDLEPETTYEYIVGFKEGGMLGTEQGVEDLKQTIKREFTTLKDTREFEILSVTPGVDALEVELKVKGLENVYYCTIDSYVREKGTEEWIYAGGIGTSYQAVNQESLPMRLSDSNIFGLKDETVYEYCIGISDEHRTPIDELIKPQYREIKTPKDISKIKITDIKIDSGRARIYYEVSGGACRTCMGIPLFYREKGAQEWISADLSGSESDVLQVSDIKEETDYEFKIGFITLRGDYKADELENAVVGSFSTRTDFRKVTAEVAAGYTQAKISMNFSGNDLKKNTYLYAFYKPQDSEEWQNAGFVSSTALAGTFSLEVRNLTPETVYDYVTVLSEEQISDPDKVYISDHRFAGQFTTKGNTYTLTFASKEELTTHKQAGVTVTAAGGNDATVMVELSLVDEDGKAVQTKTVSLKHEKSYAGEVVFTGLMPECAYVITEAKFYVQEGGKQIAIGIQKPEYPIFTPKADIVPLAFTEDTILLNAEYYGNYQRETDFEEGFNMRTLTTKLVDVIEVGDFEWKSADTSIARVDENGVVYALHQGETEITVTSKYDTEVSAACKVIVKTYDLDAKNSGNQELAENYWTFCKGEQLQVSFWTKEDAGRLELKDYNVTIEKENIVTWSEGVLTAVGVGQTRVIFEKDGVKAVTTVSVQLKPVGFGIVGLRASDSSHLAFLQEEGSYLVACGAGISYTAVGTISPYQKSDLFKADDFDWNSSNPVIVDVDAPGVITPKAAGTAMITVTPKNAGAYLQEEAQIMLTVRELPQKDLQEPVYVLTNVNNKLGTVTFSEKWSEGWHWKTPNTTFAVTAENEDVYYFEAVYEGTEYYPEEVMVPVHIGTITGLAIREEGGNHKQILETDGDSLRLVMDVMTQGVVDAKMYEIEIPTVKGLSVLENEDGSYTVQAEKTGTFTLKPVVKVNGKALKLKKTPSYKITAVKEKQVDSIELGLAQETGNVAIDKENGRMVFETLEVGKTFVLTASAEDKNNEPIATKLEWKSTDTAVVKVKADSKDSHKATVTIEGAGNAVITVTAKDKGKVQEKLAIEIQDHAPRMNTTKATVNLAYDYQDTYGKELAAKESMLELIPVYGEQITNLQLAHKETGKAVKELKVEKYGENSYLLIPAAEEEAGGIKIGKYNYVLHVTTSTGGFYQYPLAVTVTEKKPTVKVKKNNAVNLFYTDMEAEITFNVSNNARIESVLWEDGSEGFADGFSLYGGSYETSAGKYVSYVKVGQQDGLVVVNKKPQDASVTKGTLYVKLAGYQSVYELKNFSVKYTYKKPAIVSKEASTTVALELGQNTNGFTLYDKTSKSNIYYTRGASNGTTFNEIICTDSNIELKTKPYNDITYTYKGTQKSCKFKMQISSDKWREAVEVTHTVKVKNPTLKLADGTITFNMYENLKSSASTSLTVTNGVDITLTDIAVAGKNAKATNLIEKNLLVFTTDGYQIHVTQNDAGQMGETLPAGTYDYKVTPYYISAADGTKKALPALSLKVKIINKAVSASVSAKGSIDLANGTAFDVSAKKNVMWIEPKFTNLATGDKVIGYKLLGDYSHCFTLENGDGHDYIKVNTDKLGSLKANQTYKLAVEYKLHTAAGTEYTVTSKTFNVKPKQSNPKVTLSNNNQVFYAAANTLCRYYDISVPDYYRMESVSGGYDCDKDGIIDIMVSTDHMDAEGRTCRLKVEIVNPNAVTASAKGKVYTIPVTVKLEGRDGISKDASVNIKVTVKR